ncbi:hypothetical protein L3V77_02840 [Vibrio sp. DW001]|uniref:hypothetical protein n=1 Tax=Vibrio sp. DW001 TaxID=2912315 RepID=UPI0023B2007E|nr:hypothetical protein [Vibrio sp. DW001]WED27189.1 hypothetical protein L3V77_02840 [Vibrio sp. DW001]
MKALDWVAILGALAWTPHLFSFLKSYFTKPEVRVITAKAPEIGFSTLGTIFNMRVAFAVKHHDIVISNFNVRLVHESGEEKLFEWQNLKQPVMSAHTSDGSIPYERETTVLAIKLNQKEIDERFIQCREPSFLDNKIAKEDVFVKKFAFEKDKEGFDIMNLLQGQEAKDVYGYIKQAFSWKTGKYKVIVELGSQEAIDLIDNEYEFSLTPIDIDEMEKNKQCIEQEYINLLVPKEHEARKDVVWNWRHPLLIKSKLNQTNKLLS